MHVCNTSCSCRAVTQLTAPHTVLHASTCSGISTYPETRSLCGPHGLGDGPEELLCISQQELLRGLASGEGGLDTGGYRRKAADVTLGGRRISDSPMPERSQCEPLWAQLRERMS